MRILIDTNVLISAALSINSTPYQHTKRPFPIRTMV